MIQLVFEEVSWDSVDNPSSDSWYFCVQSRHFQVPLVTHVIKDPFTLQEYNACEKYLTHQYVGNEDKLPSLDQYRQNLFESFQIGAAFNQLNRKRIEIQIRASQKGNPHKSFHCLQWEQLEDKNSWLRNFNVEVTSVLVRRIVGAPAALQWTEWRYTHHVCNILLVVARKYVFDQKLDVPRPNVIKGVILSIQEELNQTTTPYNIHLEVVRPGCLNELRNHLKEHAELSGSRPYDLVHFDMHGLVSNSGKAFLIFNQYNNNGHLETQKVPASVVAQELSTMHVRCAIFNGCKTGYARGGGSANLGEIFMQYDLANILAMSYDVLDTAVEQYFDSFYRNFLVHRNEFSVSAAIARHSLQTEPRRYDYNKSVPVQVQDWFVPVVYSNDERLQVRCAPFLHQMSLEWVQKPTPLRLRLRKQHFFLIMIWMLLLTLLPLLEGIQVIVKAILRIRHVKRKVAAVTGHSFSWCSLVSYGSYRSRINRIEGSKYIETILSQSDDRKNLLRIEAVLKYQESDKKIFFYTRGNIKTYAEPLLRFAIDTWKRTNFIDCEDRVYAEWFFQHDPLELYSSDMLTLRDINLQAIQSSKNWLNLAGFELRHWLRRMFTDQHGSRLVVVVANFTTLGAPSSKLDESHHRAQERFRHWLSKHFRTPNPAQQPYLIFLGQTTESVDEQWMRERCPVLTSLSGIRAIELVVPSRALAHKPEAIPRQNI